MNEWPRRFNLVFLLLGLLLGGCGISLSTGTGVATPAPSFTQVGVSAVPSGRGGALQLFIEPNDGAAPVLSAIAGARQSILLEMYLITDTKIVHALQSAANRGVTVRVLLEPHPYGMSPATAARTMDELSSAGVDVRPTNPIFALTHAKAMVIDGQTAYIMTANFSKAALGGSSSTANREYLLADSNPTDVAAVTAIFNADWNRTAPALPDPQLVVSPVNARGDLTALIHAARKTLAIEDEEMYDPASEDALAQAAAHGVRVEVILPASGGNAATPDEQRLTAAGVVIRYDAQLYMHAKLILVDGHEAFVGSENFSAASLDENREIGLLVTDRPIVRQLALTFAQDWSASQ
jgi:cardiolipin synthase